MNKQTKFRKYFLFAMFLIGLGCFNAILPSNIFGQQKHLKKVSTKVFGRPVGKVRFGIETKENNTIANTIEVTEDEILFYGVNGDIIARRDHKSPYMIDFSRQGKYLAITEFLSEPEKGGKNGIFVFRLIDNKNRVLWERTKEYGYDYYDGGYGPRSAYISDKNATCIMFQTPWVFEMYDSTGQLIKTVKMLEDKKGPTMFIAHDCVWSEDGNFFAIITHEQMSSIGSKPTTRTIKKGDKVEEVQLPGYPPRSGNPWVFLFDHDGNEIWRRRIPNYIGSHIWISPKGGFVIATGYTRTMKDYETRRPFKNNTYIFNRDGKMIKTFDRSFKCKTFSDDDQFAFLYGGNTALLFEFSTGKIIWEKSFVESVFSCSISKNGEKFAVATRDYKGDNALPQISIFDKKGVPIIENVLLNGKYLKSYGRNRDILKLSSDGKQLSILLEGQIVSYRIED